MSCLPLEDCPPPKQGITVSRSFGRPITTLPESPEFSLQKLFQQVNFLEQSAYAVPDGFTETFVVVIQGSENGFSDRQTFQIQLWRVMVLHPVVDPDANRIPVKKT